MNHERHFLNTFGYYELPLNGRTDVTVEFEKDYETLLGMPPLPDIARAREGEHGRHNSLRNSDFANDAIHAVFYNDLVRETLETVVGDFVILSALESFYLRSTPIHRDYAGEIKTYKLTFYLDDVSRPELGPLWCIPGTHNIYDRYSTSFGCNGAWPPPRPDGGHGYVELGHYFNEKAPVHRFLSNADKIVIFNMALFHGSHGNQVDMKALRRAICMTIIPVDRADVKFMDKIDSFYRAYGVDSTGTRSYQYCQKNGLDRWLPQFFRPSSLEGCEAGHSADRSDDGALVVSEGHQRFKLYHDNIDSRKPEILADTVFNCYRDQASEAFTVGTPNGI